MAAIDPALRPGSAAAERLRSAHDRIVAGLTAYLSVHGVQDASTQADAVLARAIGVASTDPVDPDAVRIAAFAAARRALPTARTRDGDLPDDDTRTWTHTLETLDEGDRDVLLLATTGGLSKDQVAAVTGRSPHEVHEAHARATEGLAAALTADGAEVIVRRLAALAAVPAPPLGPQVQAALAAVAQPPAPSAAPAESVPASPPERADSGTDTPPTASSLATALSDARHERTERAHEHEQRQRTWRARIARWTGLGLSTAGAVTLAAVAWPGATPPAAQGVDAALPPASVNVPSAAGPVTASVRVTGASVTGASLTAGQLAGESVLTVVLGQSASSAVQSAATVISTTTLPAEGAAARRVGTPTPASTGHPPPHKHDRQHREAH